MSRASSGQLQAEEGNNVGFDEVFSLRKPRDLKAGLASGAKSVAKGVLAGESSHWWLTVESNVTRNCRKVVLLLLPSPRQWPPSCPLAVCPAPLCCRHHRPGGCSCHWRAPRGPCWIRKGCRCRWVHVIWQQGSCHRRDRTQCRC